MCDCKTDIESRILERFKTNRPESMEHSARLTGYTLIIGSSGVRQKGCMGIELTAAHPLKKGGHKAKTDRSNMIFNYCPFCGEKYEKEEAT